MYVNYTSIKFGVKKKKNTIPFTMATKNKLNRKQFQEMEDLSLLRKMEKYAKVLD